MSSARLTREELYERVWKEPMRTLAQRYNISDVGLAKTCKRLRVPVPGRGYWAKKAAGHNVKQHPLPDLPPNARQSQYEVTLADRPAPQEPLAIPRLISDRVDFENAPERRIVVSDSLRGAHPLVRKTSLALKGTAKSPTAFVGNWQEPHLDVRVSRDLLMRALLVMDAVLKAFENRGWKVTLGSTEREREHDWKSYVAVLGRKVSFGIRERIKKIENPPAKPVRLLSGGMYTPLQSKYRDEPSGRLSLVLRDSWGGNGVVTSFDDTPKLRVEDRLNEFMIEVVVRAYEDLEWDAGREDNERTWAIEADRRAEEARRLERERLRVDALEKDAVNWQKSQLLAAYLSELRTAAHDQFGTAERGQAFDDWLTWAEAYAARLNPLRAQLEKLTGLNPVASGDATETRR
jgi:hypothetical protein